MGYTLSSYKKTHREYFRPTFLPAQAAIKYVWSNSNKARDSNN